MTAAAISVVIADDQRLVRAGFRVILAGEPDIRVVGEAADGLEAVELARALGPAVVLMDIRMPNMDGLTAARQILGSGDSRVLILTTFDADEYVYETLKMGASGFLLKDAPPDQLIAAVRCIAAGDALIDPSVTRRLIGRFAHAVRPPAAQPAQLKELTSAGAGCPAAGGPRAGQRRDRRRARGRGEHDQDACQQNLDEARRSATGSRPS